MSEANRKEAAEVFGKFLAQSMRPVATSLSSAMAEAFKDVIPAEEREKEIAAGAERMMKAMEPGLVEYANEILQMVETAQSTAIDGVLRMLAHEGHAIRSDAEFQWLSRIVRLLETGAWKKHVPDVTAEEKPVTEQPS